MEEHYAVRVADAYGNHLAELSSFGSTEEAALSYILNVGKPAACLITMPASEDISVFKLDGRLGIWRSVGGYGPFLEGQANYLVRKWQYNRWRTIVTAYHANSLLSRRFVLYNKSTAFADKSVATPADDLLKTIWNENAGASINAGSRDGDETQANISALVVTQPNTSKGTSVTVQAGRRNFLEVVTELTNTAGTTAYLAAEVIASKDGGLEFRTYPVMRGRDRRVTGPSQLLFSEEMGTLANAELIVDRTEEKTFVVAVGAGDDDLRLVQSAADATRRSLSPLNRIETVVDLSNIDDDVQLYNAALAELRNNEPQIYVTAEIPDGSTLVRGVDYDFGDLITVEVRGIRYDCRLDMLRVSVGYGSRSTSVILRSLTT